MGFIWHQWDIRLDMNIFLIPGNVPQVHYIQLFQTISVYLKLYSLLLPVHVEFC